MFNLLVSADEGAWERQEFIIEAGRFLEYTDEEYKERFKALDSAAKAVLVAAPALFAYETPVGKPARVGALKTIQTRGREIRVTYEFDQTVEPIELDRVRELMWELQIGDYELNRTHWAVKDRDLRAALQTTGLAVAPPPARSVAAPGLNYSAGTLLGACDMLQALAHAGLDAFLLEVGVSGLQAPKALGGLAHRANAIKEFMLRDPEARTRDGEPLRFVVVRKAAEIERRFQGAPQYVSERERDAFLTALRRDGLEIRDGEVVRAGAALAGPVATGGVQASAGSILSSATQAAMSPTPQPLSTRVAAMPTPDGKKVFIGHGRSQVWRDLKDLLRDRLGLSPVEFNTEPTAGMTTIERLQEMLDDAAFAFLVLTGEDQHADGATHARENVIHEVGLFQGRLGFRRAIILLEDGCAEFSNIYGLTQIRFPKGDIRARSEAIREVLEREGLLPRSA